MRPNILLLHCHDLGDHLGCYPGNSAATPHLDRLAAEGVVFESHFAASPTCTPSRGAMLSGLMPHRNGLMGLENGGHWEMSPSVPTLPRLLKEAGYATACFGSWHISSDQAPFGIEHTDGNGQSETLAERVIAWLGARPKGRPFFVMACASQPHRQFTSLWPQLQRPEEVKVPGYLRDTQEIRDEMVRFYGDVSRMDACMGRVLDYVRAAGLESETLAVFTSDHGIGMPWAKGTLYDAGIKVPLIVRWPGRVRGGRRFEGLTGNVDLLPTLLEAAGEGARTPAGLDGRSLWPVLERGDPAGREQVFAEQTWHDFYEPMRAVRTRRWKLIRNFLPGVGLQVAADILYTTTVEVMREELCRCARPEYELYDMAADPWERNNLANSPATAEAEAGLRRALEEFLSARGDPILRGHVAAPAGYWEHYCARGNGPGGLPDGRGEKGWVTIRLPREAVAHECPGRPY